MSTPTIDDLITEPGVYEIPEDVYHRDPVPGGSLSSSGARRLLEPSCPAKYAYEREHGRPPTLAFNLGHAAHRKVLGAGADVVVVDAPDWRTKAAKDERDAAYAAGQVPILKKEAEQVEAMAAAIRAHPVASKLFDPERGGQPEQSLFWRDRRTGIWRRARLDWYPVLSTGRRLIIPDYKTCVSAEPKAIERASYDHGYAQQDDWYLDGVRALQLAGDLEPAFIFVFQEKTAPYIVTVAEMEPTAKRWAAAKNREAIDTYVECATTGHWPGYSEGIEQIALPAYAERQFLEAKI